MAVLGAVLVVTATLTVAVAPPPADAAHTPVAGLPELTICAPGVNCAVSHPEFVQAICPVPVGTTTAFVCPPPPPDEIPRIQLHGFTPGSLVHVWWLDGTTDPESVGTSGNFPEPVPPLVGPDPLRDGDCDQLDGSLRTHLGDVSIDTTGHGHLDKALQQGIHGDDWLYGESWICASSASHAGGTGQLADHPFVVLPAPGL